MYTIYIKYLLYDFIVEYNIFCSKDYCFYDYTVTTNLESVVLISFGVVISRPNWRSRSSSVHFLFLTNCYPSSNHHSKSFNLVILNLIKISTLRFRLISMFLLEPIAAITQWAECLNNWLNVTRMEHRYYKGRV